MKRIYLVLATAFILAATSCTQQQVARNVGGKMTVKLPKGEKLMMATWKNTDLFYLTEPMDSGYIPKKKMLRESSTYGVFETEITFIETK